MRNRLYLFIILTFGASSSILFTSCEPCKFGGKCSKKSPASQSSVYVRQCPPKPASTPAAAAGVQHTLSTPVAEYVYARKKFVMDTDTAQSAVASGAQVSANETFVSGSRLVATLDLECLSKGLGRDFAKSILAQNPNVDLSEISERAVGYTLDRDYSADEIENLARGEVCVVGLGAEHFYKPLQVATIFNDTYANKQGHLDYLHLGPVYTDFTTPNLTTPGLDVTVAIVDTGVDVGHPDLSGNILVFPNGQLYYDAVASAYGNSATEGDIDHQLGHGSHVAGLVAAVSNNSAGMLGVAPARTKIMAVRPFAYYCGGVTYETKVVNGQTRCLTHDNGSLSVCTFDSIGGYSPCGEPQFKCRNSGGGVENCEFGARNTDVVNGINFAVNSGAKIINLSLGSSAFFNAGDSAYLNALQNAVNHNVFVAMAAGNDGLSYGTQPDGSYYVSLPGRYGKDVFGAMNVGSINYINNERSSFSNYGPAWVEIGAPGAKLTPASAKPSGLYSTMARTIASASARGCAEDLGVGYGCRAGTSQASPLVAGSAVHAVMMYRTRYGLEPTAATIEDLLKLSALKSTDANIQNSFENGNILDLQNLQTTVDKYCD